MDGRFASKVVSPQATGMLLADAHFRLRGSAPMGWASEARKHHDEGRRLVSQQEFARALICYEARAAARSDLDGKECELQRERIQDAEVRQKY